MTRKSPTGKVRYAVVGGGWIAQAAFMPGVEHTGNSELTALVSGDPEKLKVLGQRYRLKTYSYERYAEALASGEFDAVYIALPNDMHREYAVAALDAGIHVLLEKPMATLELDCRAIMAAAERSGARLMIAYRLHFEPATLEALRLIHAGRIGRPRLFSSVFTQRVAASNHRANHGFWSGPVADMGPYPINAARMVFGCEPLEVSAVGVHDATLPFDFHETVAVSMRFPEDRLAQFTVSYAANPVDQYRVVGELGDLEVSPGFMFGLALKYRLTVGEETSEREFPATDQFGGELRYFSDCILGNREPEPDGSEGLADVRVLAAIERAIETGQTQVLTATPAAKAPPEPRQVEKLPMVEAPELVDAAAPQEG
jgi:predicted dehydrogenase